MRGLALETVTKAFEGLVAVFDLSFVVRPAVITALIGPNGAGKTTIFNLISGLLRPSAGRITFEGRDLTRLPPHEICRVGIGRSFQTPQTFGHMTVLENVMVAAQVRGSAGWLAAGLRLPAALREEARIRELALTQLRFLELAALATRPAGIVPLGQQRLLELARALATEPRVLLLDEPAAGLTQAEVRALRDVLLRIRGREIAILLVEHNMRFVLRTADHVVVLNHGQKLAEGSAGDVAQDPRVVAAYLGRAGEA
ncbi:MAG: ABC transporter ATP-binding protein [Candidatus Rokubacteria bacterium]|nr:ABC transporter ATP-binding protein [Candidatus Rokubacteria bacterium]